MYHRVILFLLFYLIVFSSATYDINDITGNYPYCLTASKDNKSPTSNEIRKVKSEILKKSFPFTYLEIMGNKPHDSNSVDNEVKANQWSTRNDPGIGLVEKLANDNDYSNTISYSFERTNNFNKDLVPNNVGTHNSQKSIKNDIKVSHNFRANDDFEPNNNIVMRNLRTNNQLNNMDRNDLFTNNDLESINKIGTNNEPMFHIRPQTHDSHPSIQCGEDLTESNVRGRNIQSEKMLRDANIPNVYYQSHKILQSPTKTTSDTRQKRMLLGRKKKRKKHSKTKNETDPHLEKSDIKEDKKKNKKSMKKRKFLRRKHRIRVNPKTSKDSNLNLVKSNFNSARYRRGAKSSSLFDMFSLPFDKYIQNPDQNKNNKGVKKTLKINEERRVAFSPNNIEGSSNSLTLKPDLQNKKPLQSDVLGFINCRNTNKQNSKKKQIISFNTNRIHQKTNCVSNDLLSASNFMNMFSGNMSIVALRSFLSNIDNTTHSTTVHSIHPDAAPKVKSKDHKSLVYCDVGLVTVPKFDPIYDLKNMHMTSNMATTSKEDILRGRILPKVVTKPNYQSEPDPCGSLINVINKPLPTTFATYPTPVRCISSEKPTCSTVQTTTQHQRNEQSNKSTVGKQETTSQVTTPNPDILCGSQQGGTTLTTTTCICPDNSSGNSENTAKNKIETTNSSITTYSAVTSVTGPTTPSPKKPINDLCTTTCATANAAQNYTRVTTANMSDNCTTTMPSIHNDLPATNIKDTKSTTCIAQFSLKNEKLTGNKLNGILNKVKRQALPLNLFPMLLQKDIEQPVQEGQSKKILLYLYQGNPNELSVNAKEDGSEIERFAHPHVDLIRDSNLIKKLFSPTLDIRFSSKTSSPVDKETCETKKTKVKPVASTEKCNSKESSKKSSPTTTCKNPKQISTTCKPSTITCQTITTTDKKKTTCKASTARNTATTCKTSKPTDCTTKKSVIPVKSTTCLSDKNLSPIRQLSMIAPIGTVSPTKPCNSFLHNAIFNSKHINLTLSKSQKSTTTQSITIECMTTRHRTTKLSTTSTTSRMKSTYTTAETRPSTKLTTHFITSTHHPSTICDEPNKSTAIRSTTHAASYPTTRPTTKILSTEKTTACSADDGTSWPRVPIFARTNPASVVTTCMTSPTTTCASTTKVTPRPTTTYTTTKPTTTKATTYTTTMPTTTKATTYTTTKPTTTKATTRPTIDAMNPTSSATSTTCQTKSFHVISATSTQCATRMATKCASDSHLNECNEEDDTSLVNGSNLIEYWKEVL